MCVPITIADFKVTLCFRQGGSYTTITATTPSYPNSAATTDEGRNSYGKITAIEADDTCTLIG